MYSFPNLEPVCCSMSSSTCCFLTCIQISQEAGKVNWYSHLFQNFPQFVIHTVKGFSIATEAKVVDFLEFSCLFYNPTNVGNFNSGSPTFSKFSLNIWRFSVHVLLKPSLKEFEHYLASMQNECNCVVVWTLALLFFGTGVETDLFQSCGHCWVFQICWNIEWSTFTASCFRIWNSSTGIPSSQLTLF